MKPEIKAATSEWFAGLLIGFAPLMAHGLLHFAADPSVSWPDNWAGDILFVSISNSGLSAITIFSRSIRGIIKLEPKCNILMGITIVFFFLATLVYGIVSIGHAKELSIYLAIGLLLGSAIASLFFEMAVAK